MLRGMVSTQQYIRRCGLTASLDSYGGELCQYRETITNSECCNEADQCSRLVRDTECSLGTDLIWVEAARAWKDRRKHVEPRSSKRISVEDNVNVV